MDTAYTYKYNDWHFYALSYRCAGAGATVVAGLLAGRSVGRWVGRSVGRSADRHLARIAAMIFQPPRAHPPFRLLFYPQGVALNRLGIQPTFCFSLLSFSPSPLSPAACSFFHSVRLPLLPSFPFYRAGITTGREKGTKEPRARQRCRPSSVYVRTRMHRVSDQGSSSREDKFLSGNAK